MGDDIDENIDALQEKTQEQAEKKKDNFLTKIALTTAVIAAFAAITSFIAGDKADEAMVAQIKASDQWAYYQAKSIKLNNLNTKIELLQALGKVIEEKDKDNLTKYTKEITEIKSAASDLQEESNKDMRQKKRLATAIAFFQISIAIGAVGAITRKVPMWYLSLVLAFVGIIELIAHKLLT